MHIYKCQKNMHIYKYRICFLEEGCSCCVLSFDFKPFSSVSTSHCGDSGLLYIMFASFPFVTATTWKLVFHRCNRIKSQSLIQAISKDG